MDARQDWNRCRPLCLGAGATGLVACVAIGIISPARLFRGYLVAFQFWLGIGLGSLPIVMLYHLTGGNWGRILRRPVEAATRTLPLLALFFLPLLLGLQQLYPWTDAELVKSDPKLLHKSVYLNVPFFLIRAGVYFALWLAGTWLMSRWAAEQEHTGDPRWEARMQTLSGPGIVLYGLTITFASIDWLMSLQAHWFSTMYAVIIAVGQLLAAFAFAVAVLALLADEQPFAEHVRPHLIDIGNLLLAFVMLWAYVVFAQFLLTWSGNLPEEIQWYLPRFFEGWKWIGIGLILFHFALPFVLLLSRDVKSEPRRLAAVAFLLLVMRFGHLTWEIIPATTAEHATGILGHWLEIVSAVFALLGLGGFWLAEYGRQLHKLPLLAAVDLPALRGEPTGGEAVSHG